MKKIIALVALAVVIVGGWSLLKNNKSGDSFLKTVDVAVSPISETTNVKEFTITGKPFSFTPNVLTVNKGDTVKINFVNSQGTHDLVIDEFNVRTQQILSGQSETITFVADRTGTFEYYCSVGTHRQQGMVGTLTVI